MKTPTIQQVILRIVVIFSIIELLIMLLLLGAHELIHPYLEALIDVALLAVFSTPLIYIWVIRPFISAHQQSLEHITHIACHDSLTELPNRRLLLETLEQLLSSCKRHGHHGSVMLIDLNNFKEINDDHSHAAGDFVLVEIARRLKQIIRTEDMVSRFGGDEFVLIISHGDKDRNSCQENAEQVAEKLLAALGAAISYKQTSFNVGASIGITLLDKNTSDANMAIKEADMAMYQAKQDKVRSIVFSPT